MPKNKPLEVSNCYACALIGRKRADNFLLFSNYQPLVHSVTGEIKEMDIFKIPRPENDLKLTPGFDAEYFSGLIVGSLQGCGLSHIGVPGPSRSHLPARALIVSEGKSSIGDMEGVNMLQG